MPQEWCFRAFWCIWMQAQTRALLRRTRPCWTWLNAPLCRARLQLPPLTRAHTQHSREKCKSSDSAFAAQLGLESLANSPNAAGYSSDRYAAAAGRSLPGRQNGTYSTAGPTVCLLDVKKLLAASPVPFTEPAPGRPQHTHAPLLCLIPTSSPCPHGAATTSC